MAVAQTVSWLKGHGTQNDFLVLPDPDGSALGDLPRELVAALCHRRRGIGADGVLRAIRSSALDDPAARTADAEWFMDYRNADGSLAQMCGNGLRVFAHYLREADLADPAQPLRVGTRDGTRSVRFGGATVSAEMGAAKVLGRTRVGVDGREWPALHVTVGNPHAVVIVDDLADAGSLREPPRYERDAFPDGVNVEFVVRLGAGRLAMRVFERGAGETRSCGTGACAAVAAVLPATSAQGRASYEVDVHGGRLRVDRRADGQMILSGPAVIVASGQFRWSGEQVR